MEKDTIITLDDGCEFVILEKLNKNKNNYLLAVKIDKETNEPTKDYDIFLEEKENDDYFVETLDDEELKTELLNDFANIFTEELDKSE